MRTAAVQCSHNQPIIDKVIPVYFDDDSILNVEDRMSVLLISDEARVKGGGMVALNSIVACNETIDCDTGRPYVAILMDMGVEDIGGDAVPTSQLHDSSTSERESLTKGEDTPVWRVHVEGMSDKSYPFLKQHEGVASLLCRLVVRARGDVMPKISLVTKLQANMTPFATTDNDHCVWELHQHDGSGGELVREPIHSSLDAQHHQVNEKGGEDDEEKGEDPRRKRRRT